MKYRRFDADSWTSEDEEFAQLFVCGKWTEVVVLSWIWYLWRETAERMWILHVHTVESGVICIEIHFVQIWIYVYIRFKLYIRYWIDVCFPLFVGTSPGHHGISSEGQEEASGCYSATCSSWWWLQLAHLNLQLLCLWPDLWSYQIIWCLLHQDTPTLSNHGHRSIMDHLHYGGHDLYRR